MSLLDCRELARSEQKSSGQCARSQIVQRRRDPASPHNGSSGIGAQIQTVSRSEPSGIPSGPRQAGFCLKEDNPLSQSIKQRRSAIL